MITVTVIIATYNRCQGLQICLEHIVKQEINDQFSFKVIIIDNNSTDATRDVVRSFEAKDPEKIRYLFEASKGKCRSLNTAIKQTKADIIALTDDDVCVEPQWLKHLVHCFQTCGCDGVGGRVLPVYPPETPAWIKDNIQQLLGAIVVYDYGQETKLYQKPALEFVGANYAFKRTIFHECGYFREDIGPGQGSFGDDTEFVNRVLRAGKKLFYCGEALVYHPVDIRRTTLQHIAQWHIGLGRYRILVDEQGIIDPKLVYWFGVPRYLVGRILRHGLALLPLIFDRKKFLKEWVELFVDVGRAKQIRLLYLSSKVK